MENVLEKAKAVEQYVIAFRRDLHEYPELSGLEVETQKKIMAELDELGIPYRKVGNTSLIATINEGKAGKKVALRADTDALPIKEETEVGFKSKNPGIMHACGHDAHTAMLIGAAKIFSQMKDEIPGEIRLFFQEGEETFSGAKKIVEAGGLVGVDAVFGMHGMSYLDTGYACIQPGYRMAGADTVYVKFEGVSGHGSQPFKGKDTIMAACNFVNNLQVIVTKGIDPRKPLVINVGKFVGGTKANILAKFTELDMTLRYFDPATRKIAHDGIRRHAQAIADAFEVKVDVNIEESTISLFNDPAMTEIARKAFNKIAGEDHLQEFDAELGSEDMAYYLQEVPGVFALMGYRNVEQEAIYFPHHERFKIDEAYLKYGTAMHVQFALDFLNQGSDQ